MTKRYLKTPEEIMLALKDGRTIKSERGHTYELIEDNFIIQTFLGKIRSINTTIILMTIVITLMNPNRSNWKWVSSTKRGTVEKRGLLSVQT